MKIAHIAIYTLDLDKSIAFYKLFGAVEGQRATIPLPDGKSKTLVHMHVDDVVLELISVSDKNLVKTQEGAVGHFCFSTYNIEETFEALKAAGVDSFLEEKPSKVGALGVNKKIFLTGPCGELIELIEPDKK